MNLEKRSSRALLIEDDIKKERVSTLNVLKRKIKERPTGCIVIYYIYKQKFSFL